MKKKITIYSEFAYVIGMITLALGVAFMEKANFGVSMVVAPAYILHLKISEFLPFFTFGTAEYTLQAFLLIIMCIAIRKFKISYLFSFVTAFIYGLVLDLCMMLISSFSTDAIYLRLIYFFVGMLLCAIGVSMFFRTYLSPEVYELFVKEASKKFNVNIHKFKTGYDITSCLVSVILSFSFFGLFVFKGVQIGTFFCALVNGFVISRFSKLYDKIFVFKDGLKLRPFFEGK